MLANIDKRSLERVTAAVATMAALTKTFLPFYLVGSTAIIAVASATGASLIVARWRALYGMAGKITDIAAELKIRLIVRPDFELLRPRRLRPRQRELGWRQ